MHMTYRQIDFIAFAAFSSGGLRAEDCNQNGIDDSIDLLPRDGLHLALNLPAGTPCFRILAMDLDASGGPDLVLSQFDGLAVFGNHGRAGFGAKRQIPLMKNGLPSVTGGDLDGDGLPDLAAVQYNFSTLSLPRHRGSLALEEAMVEAGRAPADIAAGDLDGDGDLDLAVVNFQANSLSVFPNSGDGAV